MFKVAVDGVWKVCPEAGGPVQFPGFNGKDTDQSTNSLLKKKLNLYTPLNLLYFYILGELICPVYHELCSTSTVSVSGHCPKSCNFNGDCVDGICQCFLGFHGHDCSKSKQSCFPLLYCLYNI